MQAQRRSSVLQGMRTGVLAVALVMAGAVSPVSAQQVLALVNGLPITSYDVDQRSRLIQLSNNKSPSRKEVLEELIDERVKVTEAKKFGLEASTAEVDKAFANMASRMGMKPAQLTQTLAGRGINANTLKARIRAELVWGNLVRGRYQASLQVGEGDIRAALGQSGADAGVGHVYTLRPILFIVPQGSPASAFASRRREAEALRSRFNGCEEGVRMARELRDVAVRTQIVRNSAALPEALRKMLNSLDIGKLTAPEATSQGIEVFALCAKEVTRAETPRKQETRQELYSKRFETHSKRYLERVRRSSMIEYR